MDGFGFVDDDTMTYESAWAGHELGTATLPPGVVSSEDPNYWMVGGPPDDDGGFEPAPAPVPLQERIYSNGHRVDHLDLDENGFVKNGTFDPGFSGQEYVNKKLEAKGFKQPCRGGCASGGSCEGGCGGGCGGGCAERSKTGELRAEHRLGPRATQARNGWARRADTLSGGSLKAGRPDRTYRTTIPIEAGDVGDPPPGEFDYDCIGCDPTAVKNPIFEPTDLGKKRKCTPRLKPLDRGGWLVKRGDPGICVPTYDAANPCTWEKGCSMRASFRLTLTCNVRHPWEFICIPWIQNLECSRRKGYYLERKGELCCYYRYLKDGASMTVDYDVSGHIEFPCGKRKYTHELWVVLFKRGRERRFDDYLGVIKMEQGCTECFPRGAEPA